MGIESASFKSNEEKMNNVYGTGIKTKNTSVPTPNIKNLFISGMAKISGMVARLSSEAETIEFNGKEYKKNDPAVGILVNRELSDIQNLNTLGTDLLTKKGSFEDQVSKMIG